MEGRPSSGVLKRRAARARELSDRLGFAYRRSRVGRPDRVLVESELDDGTLTGLGADYSRFVLPAGSGARGALVDVVVDGVAGHHLTGRPVA
jgi:tRNA A37 methylthiotransferase MiaB